MGFNDINLQVSGPQQPASIYKTKVLKGQVPFATQVTEPNTKYVIKHNFVLNGDVTIPENCILEFDGGSISGHKINNLKNSTVNAACFNLKQGDDISQIWGTGWGNIKANFDNIPLIQTESIDIGFECDYFELEGLNVKPYNNAKRTSYRCKSLHIHDCIIDGIECSGNRTTSDFYGRFAGLQFMETPNAIIENNTIQNVLGKGICVTDYCDGIIIRNNKVLNCYDSVDEGDTSGDGIYVRISKNFYIYNNTVDNEDGNQIGRCGIVAENLVGDIHIDNNYVAGYDRGIHLEHFIKNPGISTINNNNVIRCLTSLMIWNIGDSKVFVKDNYFSTEGCTTSNINPIITTNRAIIDSFGSYSVDGGSDYQGGVNAKNVIFIHNTINDNPSFRPSYGLMLLYAESGNLPQLYYNDFVSQNTNDGLSILIPIYDTSPINRTHIIIGNSFKLKILEFLYTYKMVMKDNIIDAYEFSFPTFRQLRVETEDILPTDFVIENNISRCSVMPNGGFAYEFNIAQGIVRNNVFPAHKSGTLLFYKVVKGFIFEGNTIVRSISNQADYTSGNFIDNTYEDNISKGTNIFNDLLDTSSTWSKILNNAGTVVS